MEIQRTSAGSSRQETIDLLIRDGVVIIEDALPSDLIGQVYDEIASSLAKTPNGEGHFVGFNTRRTGAILRRSRTAVEIARHPIVLEVLDKLLLPNCDCYQLHITQAISIEPGEHAQALHQDQAMYVHLPPLEGECMVNMMWPLTPFTEENGATRIIPGSNKWGSQESPPDENLCAFAEMEPGSALIYTGSVVHGGGANTSRSSRIGLVMGYSLGWLRQYENQYLAVPPSLAVHLPTDVQALLGYTVHRPNLGTYETRNPIEALQSGMPDVMAARDYLRPEEEAQLASLLSSSAQTVKLEEV